MPVRSLAGGDAACMHVHAAGPMQDAIECVRCTRIAGVRDTTAAAMPVTRVRGRVVHVLTANCIIGACGICARQAATDAVVVIEIQHA